jgi:hypothetical protein
MFRIKLGRIVTSGLSQDKYGKLVADARSGKLRAKKIAKRNPYIKDAKSSPKSK